MDSLDSLAICPYQLQDSTQCLYKADECKFLLVGQHWCVHVQESIGKYCIYFVISAQHVLLVLLE